MFGGGPVVGYRLDHGGGLVAGFEVGGGLVLAQATVGIDTVSRHGYVRFDATWDVNSTAPDFRGIGNNIGGLIGAGVTFDGHGLFAGGLNASGVVIGTSGCHGDDIVGVWVVYAELRYERGWQVVMTPRFEGHSVSKYFGCGH